jgi:hypothetical protein
MDIQKLNESSNLEEKGNHIFIPTIPTMEVQLDLEAFLEGRKTKKDRYFKVMLNPERILAEYAVYFYKSELGRAILSSLGVGVTVRHISMSGVRYCEIAAPPIAIQKQIIDAAHKLSLLEKVITEFSSEISLNPDSVDNIQNKLDSMISSINELSEGDKLLSLIRKMESKELEFKQTLSMDIKTQQKEKWISDSAIKTVAAFLNTQGGDLLIGVNDEGEIVGVNNEIEKFHKSNTDKYLLYFKDLLKTKIGEQYYPLIDHALISVNSKLVLKISCSPSSNEVFVEGRDFFVRTNPATDRLEGQKQIEYIRRRFG